MKRRVKHLIAFAITFVLAFSFTFSAFAAEKELNTIEFPSTVKSATNSDLTDYIDTTQSNYTGWFWVENPCNLHLVMNSSGFHVLSIFKTNEYGSYENQGSVAFTAFQCDGSTISKQLTSTPVARGWYRYNINFGNTNRHIFIILGI